MAPITIREPYLCDKSHIMKMMEASFFAHFVVLLNYAFHS